MLIIHTGLVALRAICMDTVRMAGGRFSIGFGDDEGVLGLMLYLDLSWICSFVLFLVVVVFVIPHRTRHLCIVGFWSAHTVH